MNIRVISGVEVFIDDQRFHDFPATCIGSLTFFLPSWGTFPDRETVDPLMF